MDERKKQYEGFASSIFDFIFSFNKKNAPPPPSRPVPGVSGNEMAYALGEIAGAPATYASEEILNAINEPLDNISVATVGKVKLDDDSAPFSAGVSVADVSDFFSNPEKFMDDAYNKTMGIKKGARDLNRMRGLGGILDLGVGAILSRSAGASAIDSLEMGDILGGEMLKAETRNTKAEELATRVSALEAAKKKKLSYDQANKLSQTFTSVLESSRSNLHKVDFKNLSTLSISERTRIKALMDRKLNVHGISFTDDDFNDLLNKYSDRAKRYEKEGSKGYHWNLGNVDKGLTERHSKGVNFNDPKEWVKSENPADKLRALKFEELEAETSFLADDDPKKLQKLKQMRHLKIWQASNGGNMKWSAKFGEARLNALTFNEMVLKGGAIPGLINGDFFDKNKNNLTPSEKKEEMIVNGLKFEDFYVPKGEDDLKNRHYARLNHLYYLTPASIGRTFFVNGEGFGYLAYLKEEKMRGMIRNSDTLFKYISENENLFSSLSFLEGVDFNNQKDLMRRFAQGQNYKDLLRILDQNRGALSDPRLVKIFGEMEKLQLKLNNSFGFKYASWIQGKFAQYQHLISTPSRLLQAGAIALFGKKFVDRFKDLFVGGAISLRRLARGLAKKTIHGLAQAFGFATTGGLANVLIYAATEVIYFVGEKMLKPLFKLFALFMWSVGMILLILLIGVISAFNSLNPFSSISGSFDTGGKAPPPYCVQCARGGISRNIYSDESSFIPDSGQAAPPEMANVDCPLQPGNNLNCSQGPYGRFSHQGTNAIDVTGPPPMFWYAPSDGVITRAIRSFRNSAGQLCGGIVFFQSEAHGVTYELLHVVPLASINQKVSEGQAVAKIALESDGNIQFRKGEGSCATGAHFHLEVSGTGVHTDRYYREFLNCNLGACP